MSRLREIFEHKAVEVERAKAAVSLTEIASLAADAPPVRPFRKGLAESGKPLSLIAEVKKASPSRGLIRSDFDPAAIAEAYRNAGADCLSVLTDEKYFEGSKRNLEVARAAAGLPCLRKDFIFDPYQVYEARAWGADCILLIVAAFPSTPLPPSSFSRDGGSETDSAGRREKNEEGGEVLRDLYALAKDLGMDVLVEVHSRREADIALALGADMIGVNNRNLADMSTALSTSEELLPLIAPHALAVSESALETPEDLARVKAAGASAVLIGTAFCSNPDIESKVREVMGW
ncbi:MAG TPA: indole-3-glycerol phosphate synthase TrpC [Fimbriimonadaceae bacterium]|nr:indole-3-glycerol phosphate synthase TrpC [Fimbriimonadaceae bacterium]